MEESKGWCRWVGARSRQVLKAAQIDESGVENRRGDKMKCNGKLERLLENINAVIERR